MSDEPKPVKPVKLRLCLVPENVPAYPLAVYTREAARLLKMRPSDFRRKVREGEIRAKLRGDRLLFLVGDLASYLERLPDYRPGSEMRPEHLQKK